MKERIAYIMDRENLSPTKLAEILKIQPSNVSHLLSGRNKPSFELMGKVFEAFPHISADWFITGRGEYLKASSTIVNRPIVKSQSLFDEKNVITSVNPAREPINTSDSARPSSIPPVDDKVLDLPQYITARASRIIVFYDDNSFEEFIPRKK